MLAIIAVISLFTVLRGLRQVPNRVDFSAVYGDGDLPENIGELLDEKYGSSIYMCSSNGITVSLAYTENEKHYIKYSWVNSDPSCFTMFFFIENDDMKALPSDEDATAIITYENGAQQTPFYSILSDWPQDDPLLYKKLLTVRFLPLRQSQTAIDLTVYFNGEKYIIENINIACNLSAIRYNCNHGK